MSSNRRPEAARRLVGWIRGWSLRTRLTVILTALLALACIAVGVGTEVALRGFLMHQLDRQLIEVGSRAAQAAGNPASGHGRPVPPGADPSRGPDFLARPGKPDGTLGARVVDGRVYRAAKIDVGGVAEPVDPSLYDTLLTVPVSDRRRPEAVSRNLGKLRYRLVALRTRDGQQVIVTGVPLSNVDQTLVQVALIELIIAAAALLIGGTAGTVIVRYTLRPLHRVASTASRVAELPLDRGEVALSVRVPQADARPGTEVGQVGAAINRMLGHVAGALSARHASEQRVRQFVADASHELRTPLAAIRGYAELTRRGRHELPDDVAHAMGRVESESARMTTLVEDLLLLARLDSGRPLTCTEVDLTRLVADAVSDAHVAGADHRWRLDLPAEPVSVPGDAPRLHQVLANLLSNARAHTPAGTTVTTGLRREAGLVVLTVTDDGPGIPAELLPNVFERFARGDSSRSRSAGSTGLGLAIVSAVVAAHHGHVELRSTPGETVLTVLLPVDPAGTA